VIWGRRLIIVSGEEGAGKSTIVRALLPSTPQGARIDPEDIGQTNPLPDGRRVLRSASPECGRIGGELLDRGLTVLC
jgi:predicted ABC-type ATPase